MMFLDIILILIDTYKKKSLFSKLYDKQLSWALTLTVFSIYLTSQRGVSNDENILNKTDCIIIKYCFSTTFCFILFF